MTKKMTFTLEESLVDQLSTESMRLGKKKTQIVREALNLYFSDQSKNALQKQWQEENMKAIDAYNDGIEHHGVFSEGLRTF